MEKKNCVLIVDDDPSNLMELFYILRSDYNLITAIDGKSALEKANELVPDLILLDVFMSDIDGFEVLAKLKESDKTKAIPVILISGLKDDGKGLAVGAADYIRKPYSADLVKLKVSQQIKAINQ